MLFKLWGKIFECDDVFVGKDFCPVERVHELPDIARPRVFLQGRTSVGVQFALIAKEMVDQQANVAASLAQGRQFSASTLTR